MSYRSLRDFLAKLEKEGQLVHYHEEILPEPDIGALNRAAGDLGDSGPAVLLDNVIGYKGKKLVVGIHGSWANHALMLDMPKSTPLKEQFFELSKRWDTYPGEVKWVENAPCQEVVIEKGLNLYEILPLYRINKLDGGFYFSKASVVTKEPFDPQNFDAQNVGTYRLQVQGPNTLGLQAAPFHDIGAHYAQAEKLNQPLPIAICLGVDPVLTFMASTPIAYNLSEYKYAAALNGIPMELTKCLTCDLDVPANAEYVLEGVVIPKKRTVEGPFGEFPGTYSGVRRQLEVKITKVTHREDPIFENLYIGRSWTEADTLLGLNTCVPLYKQLKTEFPEVQAVNALYQHGLTTIVSTKQKYGGYAKTIAMRLASTPHGAAYCRNIIMVDGDIDPFNLTEVMWALSTRVRDHNKDIIEIPLCPGIILNPADEPDGMSRKLIIDATTPVAPDGFRDAKMVKSEPLVQSYKKVLAELHQAK
ncbi:MAG TPA: non-oxidative hydroxyarylic acid decarboxylases subunit C [Syntrophomonadaceae bacterium]|nr:non-oxidative hydroxyarylic acid decarboxylases subunit C [Syntrophomonadaceae bacterium]